MRRPGTVRKINPFGVMVVPKGLTTSSCYLETYERKRVLAANTPQLLRGFCEECFGFGFGI
jgi:hypothetical protein